MATTALVMLLGMLMFVAAAGSFRDIRHGVTATEQRLHLADLTVWVVRADAAAVRRVSQMVGVQQAEGRLVVDLPVIVLPQSRGLQVQGRLISLPDARNPRLDRLELVSGRWPVGNQVLVEKHFAENAGLRRGDAVMVRLPGRRTVRLQVAGVCVSAEYLWVSRSREDPMPTPSEFGVFWIPHSILLAMQARSTGRFNQILCQLKPGASLVSVRREVYRTLGRRRVEAVVSRDELSGVRLLRMDLDSLASIAGFFPACFVVVAVLTAGASQARLVDAQKPVIGTLLALGMPRRRILWHYLGFGLVSGAIGSAIGACAGLPTSVAMTREYASLLAIPNLEPGLVWPLAVLAVAVGLVASFAASILPAWRAAMLPPSEAMRPPFSTRLRGLRFGRHVLERLPLGIAYPIRNALRRPWRSLATTAGMAVALAIVLAVSAVFEGVDRAVDLQFQHVQRYDLRAALVQPIPMGQLLARLEVFPQVRQVEGILVLPIQLRPELSSTRQLPSRRTTVTVLIGLPPRSPLLRSLTYGPKMVRPSPGTLVLARSLAREIGVSPGQGVLVRLPGGAEREVEVSALSDSAIGGAATM
ncbi:MAG: FtsX-like permease family protein, partial [Cyanobacteria bacterium REEB65]|nr:FtsX-like permease family protein [Cyanobacteria bacterium REEB65]